MAFAQTQSCVRCPVPVTDGVGPAPYGVDLALIDAALTRVIRAGDCLSDGRGPTASRLLHAAMQDIVEFRSTLDLVTGGPLTANLDDLCGYLGRRLMAANLRSDLGPVTEVTHLMHEVRAAWVTLAHV
jgi:flagellar protein FliS